MQKRRLKRKYNRTTDMKPLVIQFRISNDEHEKLRQAAAKIGLPLASYARLLCIHSKGIKVN